MAIEEDASKDRLSPRMVAWSLLGGVVVLGVAWLAADSAKPPEGVVFQRLPITSGVYRCCNEDRNSRSSQSTIDDVGIDCRATGYFPGGRMRDCGVRHLNLKVVEVQQVLVPTLFGPSPVVSRISFGGQDYLRVDDKEIRERWLRNNILNLAFAGPMGAVFSALFLSLFKLFRKRWDG